MKMILMLTLSSFAFLLGKNNLLHSSNIKVYHMPDNFLGLRYKIFRARHRLGFKSGHPLDLREFDKFFLFLSLRFLLFTVGDSIASLKYYKY